MAYDPTKFVTQKMPKAGETVMATVLNVTEGKYQDFVDPEVLAKWKNAEPGAAVIEVVAVTDNGFTRKRTIPLPLTEAVHPNSILAKWKLAYKDYPHVDQRVDLVANEEGFFQFRV